MTASKLSTLITFQNLRYIWKAFWRESGRQQSAGVDNVTPAIFNRDVEKNLSQILYRLRQGYEFSPLRGVRVPKKDGKRDRIICVPTVQDRIVQRLLSSYLNERAESLGILNDVSFGFVQSKGGRKRGVQAARDRAIALRTQNSWAYKSDITSFFDRIPRNDLVDRTIRYLRAPSFRQVIMDVVSCEIESDPAISRIALSNGIKRGLGIRQGMPLSPLFANIILRDFDREMIKLGKNMVRYADDFIVLAKSKEECLEIDAVCRSLLRKIGLEIPQLGGEDTKIYIAEPKNDIEFLGMALAHHQSGEYKLVITEDQIKNIKRKLFEQKDIEKMLKDGITISTISGRIENKVGGYKSAYRSAHNFEELDSILATARAEIFRSFYVKAFGEDKVQKLNYKMKKFLCLEIS